MYRIEKQVIRWVPQSRALEPLLGEQRGTLEETNRILREIERINVAMGYKRKTDIAFPRTQSFNEGYFYPRPVFFPSSVRVQTEPSFTKHSKRIHPAQDPFRVQSFFYPTPYLELPSAAKPRAFRPFVIKESRQLEPKIYILPISVPSADGRSSEIRYVPSTMSFDSFAPLRQKGKALDLTKQGHKKAKGVMDDVAAVVGSEKLEEEFLEEIADAVDYDDEEEERQEVTSPAMPALHNDKFLGGLKGKPSKPDDDSEPDIELIMLQKAALSPGMGKSFNISNAIQNFTNRFNLLPSFNSSTQLPVENKDLKETPEPSAEDDTPQDKGPFGFFSTKQADPGTGLVIQRLRVRQGGIAIAGPGGVATAGSGGTAIVGPNGTAITHPRSLTIAGPGAKVYAVPETVDLANTINATKRSLPLDAVLVANGPVVYYRT